MNAANRTLVILPTYNERDNVGDIVPAIIKRFPEVEILVVDDGSPDGTATMVREMQSKTRNLHLIERKSKDGLGPAYIAGFRWALERNFSRVVQMDADFSHRLEDLAVMLKCAQERPVVIGSRWIPGGAVANWSVWRRWLSRVSNMYVGMVLTFAVRDWTGGFNIWQREVLESIGHDRLESLGYVFQIELKYRALKLNFPLFEVPIRFEERRSGQSKMSLAIVAEAWWRVWLLRHKLSSFSSPR